MKNIHKAMMDWKILQYTGYPIRNFKADITILKKGQRRRSENILEQRASSLLLLTKFSEFSLNVQGTIFNFHSFNISQKLQLTFQRHVFCQYFPFSISS